MPLVSIIVPCYNEQSTIRLLLDAVYNQSVPLQNLEVVIADGLSTDRTCDQIALFQQQHPELEIRLVENPKRIIPAALNRALEVARGEYIVRLDAHSIPAEDYIERCVESLEAGLGENVGGVWEIRPQGNNIVSRAIAIAAGHPLGVGDARYRYTNQAGYVDTVPFGSFKREIFDKFGFFDESLLTNEDYEFNARLRQNGARIWIDPQIRSTYFARSNLPDLAKQYWRYGYWKWRMLKRYPTTLRWRQALPPAFVASIIVFIITSVFFPPARVILASGLFFYFLAIFLGSLNTAQRNHDFRLAVAVPVAIATMHFSWGSGFIWSMFSSIIEIVRK